MNPAHPHTKLWVAREAGVPVLIYASMSGVTGRIEDYIYPVYLYLHRHLSGRRPFRRFIRTPEKTG